MNQVKPRVSPRVKRYLQTVKLFLPASQQKDILAEISEDLRTQVDDLETELGRNPTGGEIAQLLKRRGSAFVVAGGYLPQQNLIGPAFFPIYRFVLRMVLLWIQVPVFVLIVGPINFLTSPNAVAAVVETVFQLAQAWFIAFGVITFTFALVDRRSQTAQPSSPRARRIPITDLVNTVAWIALWIYVPGIHSRFDVNTVHLVLAPIWQTLFWPVLILSGCAAVLRCLSIFSEAHAKPQALARLAIDCAAIGIALFLLSARSWVQISAPLTPSALETASNWANINVAILIAVAATMATVDAVKTARRLLALPQNIQNRGQFPPDLRQRTIVK